MVGYLITKFILKASVEMKPRLYYSNNGRLLNHYIYTKGFSREMKPRLYYSNNGT